MSPIDTPRSHLVICVLILITLNLALFLPAMRGDFLWDDKYFIGENPNIQSPHFLRSFLVSPFGGFSGLDDNSAQMDRIMQFYRPLTSLSYWLDFKVWGLNPAAFHLTNILLHMANCALLFLILLSLRISLVPAFSGALLFSAFPLHFENVAWISGRTDLLSFLFGALSVWFLVKFLNRRRGLYLGLSALLFLFSLLSKETALLLSVLYLFVFLRKDFGAKKAFLSTLPFGTAVVVWFVLRRIAFGSVGLQYSGRTLLDFFAAIGFYTAKMFFPFHLSVTINPVPVFKNPIYQIAGAILTVLFLISLFQAVQKKRKDDRPFLVFGSYFLLLLPSAAAIFSASTISLLAWRFLYLPSAVFVTSLVFVLFKALNPKAAAIILLLPLFIFYASGVYPKNQLYGNEETAFWLSITDIEREDVLARFNIGIKGLAEDETKSLAILNQILGDREHPLYQMLRVRIYEELAAYYTGAKRFGQAAHYFSELFKIQSSHSLVFYFNYSYFLALTGKVPEGEKIISEIIKSFPQNHYVLTKAAKFYLIIKDYAKAAEFYDLDYSLFRNKQTLLLLQQLQPLLKKGN
jgi:tetratricopeptide (TPR) repeat protein